jgi:hypothetical protein
MPHSSRFFRDSAASFACALLALIAAVAAITSEGDSDRTMRARDSVGAEHSQSEDAAQPRAEADLPPVAAAPDRVPPIVDTR